MAGSVATNLWMVGIARFRRANVPELLIARMMDRTPPLNSASSPFTDGCVDCVDSLERARLAKTDGEDHED
jgi:hypothetical protein